MSRTASVLNVPKQEPKTKIRHYFWKRERITIFISIQPSANKYRFNKSKANITQKNRAKKVIPRLLSHFYGILSYIIYKIPQKNTMDIKELPRLNSDLSIWDNQYWNIQIVSHLVEEWKLDLEWWGKKIFQIIQGINQILHTIITFYFNLTQIPTVSLH